MVTAKNRRLTRVPPLSAPRLEQSGTMMQSLDIHRVVKMVSPPGLEASTVNMTLADLAPSMAIHYSDQGSECLARLTLDGLGTLRCHFCASTKENLAWCPHVRYAISERADGPLLCERLRRAGGGEAPVVIPVVPSEGVFIGVTMAIADGFPYCAEVVMTVPTLGHGEMRGYHLGYFPVPGLAMADLRTSIIDTLHGIFWDAEVFHQAVPDADGEYSPFTGSVFRAILGVGPEQDAQAVAAASDAPKF